VTLYYVASGVAIERGVLLQKPQVMQAVKAGIGRMFHDTTAGANTNRSPAD
jgi:hypothetical protein